MFNQASRSLKIILSCAALTLMSSVALAQSTAAAQKPLLAPPTTNTLNKSPSASESPTEKNASDAPKAAPSSKTPAKSSHTKKPKKTGDDELDDLEVQRANPRRR
jgi:hypothetical protein